MVLNQIEAFTLSTENLESVIMKRQLESTREKLGFCKIKIQSFETQQKFAAAISRICLSVEKIKDRAQGYAFRKMMKCFGDPKVKRVENLEKLELSSGTGYMESARGLQASERTFKTSTGHDGGHFSESAKNEILNPKYPNGC